MFLTLFYPTLTITECTLRLLYCNSTQPYATYLLTLVLVLQASQGTCGMTQPTVPFSTPWVAINERTNDPTQSHQHHRSWSLDIHRPSLFNLCTPSDRDDEPLKVMSNSNPKNNNSLPFSDLLLPSHYANPRVTYRYYHCSST